MGIGEIAALVAANLIAQGAVKWCGAINADPTTTPWWKITTAIGGQLASRAVAATWAGLAAANAEFSTTQAQEKQVQTVLNSLPPITYP